MNRERRGNLAESSEENRGLKKLYPSLVEERQLWRAGFDRVAGLDEAGRGALAGPVVAGAVILQANTRRTGLWAEVQDSKLLSPPRREELSLRIQEQAAAWSLGEASAAEIDACGIAPATRLAMRRAVEALSPSPDHLLLDWVQLKSLNLPQLSFTKGDLHVVTIAAASILAKVHRDRLLCQLHERFPAYGFHSHKGYAARSHLAAIEKLGPCPAHRRSFSPLRKDETLFDRPA
ncbi:MAG: ribonuclease HII [Caldilineaceae bacterium SB0670_bin_27]|uniref:Ribonuclease HII n=1 Tax=Caldilineaceae bacterium SB0664_bin_27 TaxID=2605260 RepID=A0A6B0YY64_9CHLR|nr:ribonuclease HII [Caldilineaceae bacterium SB0664_bin_27]MYJ78520.1 ribonuclease HII [Caldilineaceae bacterium SB0670_bin_27]